jgi:hypothetical protein
MAAWRWRNAWRRNGAGENNEKQQRWHGNICSAIGNENWRNQWRS